MAVALDVAVVLDAHGARDADPAKIVSAEVDQHQMLGPLLLVGQQILLQELVVLLGVAAPPGTGDRMGLGEAVLDGHQCLRAGTHDRKRRCTNTIGDVEQIHVRAGIGHPQHAVDVDRIGGGVHLEALRRHHLERLPRLDLADQPIHDRAVLLGRALRAVPRFGPGEGRHRGSQRLRKRTGHHVEAADGVVVGGVDVVVGAVPIHRIGDQRDGALVVVDGGDVGGQQQQHVRQSQIVDGQFGQTFQAPDEVVGEEPHQSAGQGRHAGRGGSG